MVRKTVSKKVKKNIGDYVDYLKSLDVVVERVFLFGSYAQNKQNKISDIDICVVASGFKTSASLLKYLWAKKRNKDIKAGISPVGFIPQDFINDDPLVWEIKNKGIAVAI